MSKNKIIQKGRGANTVVHSQFNQHEYFTEDESLEYCHLESEEKVDKTYPGPTVPRRYLQLNH